jgi:8-oxo-dGTP pyrophosphatase MutT (NUDIX family)
LEAAATSGEAPHITAEREVAEEIGLDLIAHDLVVVDYCAAFGGFTRRAAGA